jgi:hypothetical protein
VEPKAGRHFTKVTPNRSAPQFADYLLEIVAAYPEADTIHLVMDNLSSHRRKALVDRYGERIGGLLWDLFTVHYTPKHGSWLNLPRSRSACSGVSALGFAGFHRLAICAAKRKRGTGK